MAKLKTDPIQQEDIQEYLNSYSDFTFELHVLRMLRDAGVDCEHGGHYEDPVTKKSREFDIRASKSFGNFRVRLAIECKNIRDNFPLLVIQVPRHQQESFHQIALVSDPKSDSFVQPAFRSRATIITVQDEFSMYKPQQPVGKSTIQIGKSSDERITSNDSEVFEKWGQCLSSAQDLFERLYRDRSNTDPGNDFFSTVFTFLVIPDGRLWAVTFDENGETTSEPTQVNHCSCFVNKEYEIGSNLAGAHNMRLSHMEIVTHLGMRSFIEAYLSTEQGMRKVFPPEAVMSHYGVKSTSAKEEG